MSTGPTFSDMVPVAFFGAVAAGGIVIFAVLLYRSFPKEIAALLQRLSAPSDASCKRKSVEMLAQMNKNIAERKARQSGN